jgi:hypothetical protein
VWKDLDAQIREHLHRNHISLAGTDPQAHPGPNPQVDFQAMGWRLLTPASGAASHSRRFSPSGLCHYEFTVSYLVQAAKKTKNPEVKTWMLLLGSFNFQ